MFLDIEQDRGFYSRQLHEPLVAAVPIHNPGGGGFIFKLSSLANFPDIIRGYRTLLPLSIRSVVSTRSYLLLILMGTLHFSHPIAALVCGPEGSVALKDQGPLC